MYPVLVITPTLSIPTYYLILSFSICLALLWLSRRAEIFNLSRKLTLDVSLIVMVAGFFGARLFHIFYEDFEYYDQSPMRMIEFWNGGFVYYGGAFLAAICGISYVYFKQRSELEKYLDLFAPVFAFTYAVGRLGCLFAGCCYGKYCELPWAVSGKHPTQLYAAVWEFGSMILLLALERVKPEERKPGFLAKPGAIFYLWTLLHGVGRLLMETYRDDFRGPAIGFSISGWLSVLIILGSLYFLLRPPKSTN